MVSHIITNNVCCYLPPPLSLCVVISKCPFLEWICQMFLVEIGTLFLPRCGLFTEHIIRASKTSYVWDCCLVPYKKYKATSPTVSFL